MLIVCMYVLSLIDRAIPPYTQTPTIRRFIVSGVCTATNVTLIIWMYASNTHSYETLHQRRYYRRFAINSHRCCDICAGCFVRLPTFIENIF